MNDRQLFLFLLAFCGLFMPKAWADASPLPGAGYEASRYEALWTKSPFSVSTPDAAPDSPDYALVGVARFDGIYYASLIDQKSQEHFLVTTAKPARGLTLLSVTPGKGNSDTFAMVEKEGQTMTLKMVQVAAASGPNPNPNLPQPPQPPTGSVLPMPGAEANGQPPMARHRLPPAHLPPRPPPAVPAPPQ